MLPLAGADFVSLNLKIIEGEGMVYAPGSRATRGITVEVVDETGRPIPGVSVSFQLPDDGPSGVFISGGRIEIANTGQDGRATVWGMRWNKLSGAVNIRVTAAKEGIRSGMVVVQKLDASVPAAPAAVAARPGHSRVLLITLAVAGAAGAALAAGALRGSQKTASAAPTQTLSIGTPTVIIGAP